MNLVDINGHLLPLWWERERLGGADGDLARAVIETVQDIEQRQLGIHEGNKRHARIYAGYLPSGFDTSVSASSMRAPFAATKALVRSVCDTATSMIVRSRPRPSFMTDGADFKVQQAAEDMDQFIVGAFTVGGLYKVAPRAFHDSTVFGSGGWKLVTEGTGDKFKVCYERFLIDDIVVDEDECRESMEPQNLYQRTVVRVGALIRKYAAGDDAESRERRMALLSAANSTANWPTVRVPREHCVLVEAYHLGPEGNRRVLCAGGVVLEDQVWPHDFFPYEFLRWALPITGFYGDGIAYRQFGRQERITYMHRWVTKVLDTYGTPTAWIDPAGGPPTLQMSNEIGKVIMARRKPEFQTSQIVPAEIYRWLDKLERDGYEDEGVSIVTSAGDLPPGVDSAPAQREYSYKESQRFATVSQRWEDAIADGTARKTVAMYRRHAAGNESQPRVRWADRRLMYDIAWPDLDADAYMIRPEAASIDSLSPAARTQSALELAQTGWITPAEGRALVGHPDLKESDELGNAPINYAKWVLRKLVRGETVLVDEKSELPTLLDVVNRGRLLAITRNAPEKIIAHLDRFIESVDGAIKEAQAEQLNEMMQQQAAMAPQPGVSTQSAEGRPAPFAGGKGYT